MGCDIHLFCEAKKSVMDIKKWVNCDNWKVNPYYNPTETEEYEPEYIPNSAYSSRNYALFAKLADVRSYGKDVCIDSPRGLPSDVTPYTRRESDRWGDDGHSASWFTLRELMVHQKESGGLEDLIDNIIPLYKETFWIWRDKDKEAMNKNLDNFRVVFWFDN